MVAVPVCAMLLWSHHSATHLALVVWLQDADQLDVAAANRRGQHINLVLSSLWQVSANA